MLQAHDVERLIDRVPEIGARMRRVAEDRAPQRVATAAERPRRKRKPETRGDAAQSLLLHGFRRAHGFEPA